MIIFSRWDSDHIDPSRLPFQQRMLRSQNSQFCSRLGARCRSVLIGWDFILACAWCNVTSGTWLLCVNKCKACLCVSYSVEQISEKKKKKEPVFSGTVSSINIWHTPDILHLIIEPCLWKVAWQDTLQLADVMAVDTVRHFASQNEISGHHANSLMPKE